MCPDCMKPKMLFETERKAQDFIRWNADDMEYGGEQLRAYYCPACCGWHISSHEHREDYDRRTDKLIEAYHKSKEARKVHRKEMWLSGNIDAVKQKAVEIFDSLPEVQFKSQLKMYLKDYFVEHHIDSRCEWLRAEIYRIWKARTINNEEVKRN